MSKNQRARGIALLACLFAVVFSSVFAVVSIAVSPRIGRAAPEAKSQADPKAMATLARSAAYLRGLPAFALTAQVTQDEIVNADFKLQRAADVQVAVRRPDRMRAEVSGDTGKRVVLYDGKELSVYLKDENYYGSVGAPATLRETLGVLERHGIDLPLVDLVFVAMGGQLDPGIRDAGEVGPSVVDGVPCMQLAFRGANVDWQLWIEEGSRPLPRKLVITTNDEPTRPQYSANIRWDLAAPQNDETFAFAPPPGTLRMTFDGMQPPAGAKTPSKAGPGKGR